MNTSEITVDFYATVSAWMTFEVPAGTERSELITVESSDGSKVHLVDTHLGKIIATNDMSSINTDTDIEISSGSATVIY